MSKYHFRLEGSGLGETIWRVSGAGDITRLRVRYEATPYQRSISSLSDAEWERDIVGAIDLLVDASGERPVPQDVVDAFNAWRESEYWRHRREIDAQPERYGVVDWDHDALQRPRQVRGAHYLIRKNRPDAGADWWRYGSTGLGWAINT